MELHEIEVTIGKDGRVEIGVRGMKGKGCLDVTKALEAALGGQVEAREMTPEADDESGERVGDQAQQWGG